MQTIALVIKQKGARGNVIELTRTDRELVYLLSQFTSARPGVVIFDVFPPKAALPKVVVSVRSNEWGGDRLERPGMTGMGREADFAIEDVVCGHRAVS